MVRREASGLLTAAMLFLLGCSNESSRPNLGSDRDDAGPRPEPPAAAGKFGEILERTREAATKEMRIRGIRLLPSAQDPNAADRILPIVQAEPFSEGFLVGKKGENTVMGKDPNRPFRFDDIEPGDLLELTAEPDVVYRIKAVIPPDRLVLAAPLGLEAVEPTGKRFEPNYSIHRSTRVERGAVAKPLPDGWRIDLSADGLSSPEVREVMFNPSGQVVVSDGDRALLFWLRGPAEAEAVVRLDSTTGTFAVYPVNRDPRRGGGDPLYYVNNH